jgi:hypothetical protein
VDAPEGVARGERAEPPRRQDAAVVIDPVFKVTVRPVHDGWLRVVVTSRFGGAIWQESHVRVSDGASFGVALQPDGAVRWGRMEEDDGDVVADQWRETLDAIVEAGSQPLYLQLNPTTGRREPHP